MPRPARSTVPLAALVCALPAAAQSFNLDFDMPSGPGSGVPAWAFGGAAGVPGVWNAISPSAGGIFVSLRSGTGSGELTPARFAFSGGFGGFGFDNATATGNFALLMEDIHDLRFAEGSYFFLDLIPGRYEVYTYALQPDSASARVRVTVEGSSSTNPQIVGGAVPAGSAFVQGTTHAMHTVDSTGAITVRASSSVGSAGINGFQLHLVAPSRLYVNAAAPATGATGRSWAQAFPSLESALQIARDNPGAVREIWVAAGTYTPSRRRITGDSRSVFFEIPSGVAIYGGFNGLETALSQRNPIANATILSGELGSTSTRADNAYNVLRASNTAPGTRLEGVIVRGAFNDLNECGAPCFQAYGGGLLVSGGHLTVAVSSFLENASATVGLAGFAGGVFARGDAQLVLQRVGFFNNEARFGGGLYVEPAANVRMINCALIGNTATVGGAAIRNAGTLHAVNTVINGNRLLESGIQPGSALDNAGTATLVNCTIVNNSSTYSLAGTISTSSFAPAGASVTLLNAIVWNNSDARIIHGPATVGRSIVQGGHAGGGVLNADPRFVNLAGADGVPGTLDDNFSLAPNSPAIDRGFNDWLPADIADLDADGNTTEILPLDYALLPRRRNDAGTPDAAPSAAPVVDLGAVEFTGTSCRADVNRDGAVNSEDITAFLTIWFADRAATPPTHNADFDRNAAVNSADITEYLTSWFAARTSGC